MEEYFGLIILGIVLICCLLLFIIIRVNPIKKLRDYLTDKMSS